MELTGIRTATELNQANASDAPGDELGQTQFLELMLAQLRNQDPLDPADNEAFVAQLAQFSTLEGITNLNDSVASMGSAIRSQLTLQSAGLVGRSVLVPTNTTLMEGAGLVGNIELSQSTANLSVEIAGQAGETIRRLELGAQSAGSLRFQWDGTDENGAALPPGIYQVRATSLIEGEAVQQEVRLPERVVSVTLADDGARVNLAGGTDVSVTDISEIQ